MTDAQDVTAPPSVLTRYAEAYAAAELEVERIEERLKAAKASAAGAEKRLVEEMITQQVKSFKTDAFGGFRTQAVVYPNVKDREALTSFVDSKKSLRWLITKSINGTKLKSFVKELIEQGKPIPPGIEPYTTTEIRRYK